LNYILIIKNATLVDFLEPVKLIKPKHRGRPTKFSRQLEMAKISWAPVLEYLSLIDSKKITCLEDIPFDTSEITTKTDLILFERKQKRKKIVWITGNDIKKIHDDMIFNFGGELGIKDKTTLDAVIDRAKNSHIYGVDQLDTIIHKAAFLMHSLLRYHQFVDGQKRTGVSTAFIFLGLNGYAFWSRNVLEEIHYCIEIANGKHEVEEIADWLAKRILTTEFTSKSIFDFFLSISQRQNEKMKPLFCSNCHNPISPKAFRIKCPKCQTAYELRLTELVITKKVKDYDAAFKLGLHKLEDNILIKEGIIDTPKII
jgi:death-on-curing protein